MKQPTPIYQGNYNNVVYSDNIPPVLTETIKESGCGIVSAVMMLNAFDIKVTVQELAKLSMDNHFRVEAGTSWALFPFIAKQYGLQLVQTDDMADVKKALQDGKLVICSMGPGTFTKGGHFILAYDFASGLLYFDDPASSARTGKGYSPDLVQKEHKEYFVFSKPAVEMNVNAAIDIWAKAGVIGDPDGMKNDFKTGKFRPDRYQAFLIKSAKYISKG